MLTTEPVFTEVAYFLRTDRVDIDPLFQLLERDAVRLDLQIAEHWPRLRTLMARYDQMNLADTSIVVMNERYPRSQVLTVDRTDFSIYRRNDRQVIFYRSAEIVRRFRPVFKRVVQDGEERRLEKLCRRSEQLEKLRLSWTFCGVRHKPQQVQVDCDDQI